MLQQTLQKNYAFEGKGLHSGKHANLILKPAPADSGIVFVRTDIGPEAIVEAKASNVSNTERSTVLEQNGVVVRTVEHVLSALTGLGVDNAVIEIDNIEIPILDGSAGPYTAAITKDGLSVQDAERRYIGISEDIIVSDENTGAYIKISAASKPEYDVTVDFNSRVLGVQQAQWNSDIDYASEIGSCRTFVFFHEIEYLFNNGLVKGGDVDNAIVIVEHPVNKQQLDNLAKLFNQTRLGVSPEGYLSNLTLRFQNECGRHKLLDLIGDMRLCGGFLNATITAYKPGHALNTRAAKAVCELIENKRKQ